MLMEASGTSRMTKLFSIAEVQDQLRVSRSTVYRLKDQGEISFVHVGRAVRVPSEDVAALMRRLCASE